MAVTMPGQDSVLEPQLDILVVRPEQVKELRLVPASSLSRHRQQEQENCDKEEDNERPPEFSCASAIAVASEGLATEYDDNWERCNSACPKAIVIVA